MKRIRATEDEIEKLIRELSVGRTVAKLLEDLNLRLCSENRHGISRTTLYRIKAKYNIISDKNAERDAKRQVRSVDKDQKLQRCVSLLEEKYCLTINNPSIKRIVKIDHQDRSASRRRTRYSITYTISEIREGSSVDSLLLGLQLQQSCDDLERSDKSSMPSLKSLSDDSLNEYDKKLCSNHEGKIEWIKTVKGLDRKPSKIIFNIQKGRLKGFRGVLVRDSLRNRIQLNDPRTLVDDDERFEWLNAYLEKYECRLLSKGWPGSRARIEYICSEGHRNTPILTNLFKSIHGFSCPICHDFTAQADLICSDREYASREVILYLVRTNIHPVNFLGDEKTESGDGSCGHVEIRCPINVAVKVGFTCKSTIMKRSRKYIQVLFGKSCSRTKAFFCEQIFLYLFSRFSLQSILEEEGHRDDGYTEMFDMSILAETSALEELLEIFTKVACISDDKIIPLLKSSQESMLAHLRMLV